MTSEDSEEPTETREASAEPAETAEAPESTADSPGSAEEDVPLQIAGHEQRERPDESSDDASETQGLADGGTGLVADAPSQEALAQPATPESVSGEPSIDAKANDEEVEADGDDEEVEPVEVLVNLAEDGEIDPWDIDIVAVTDKFLDRLDEADLRTSGRALFYASVLLRMKGDAMLEEGDDEDDEPWDEPWEQPLADDEPVGGPDPFAALESEMDRRLERKRARGMPQTLDELVRDLREAERDTWWKESREYDTSGSPHGFQRGTQELDYRAGDDLRMDDEPTEDEVTGTAHDEDIDVIIEDVHAALREHYDKGREEVLYREIEDAGGSRVETFLGLLFLSHRGRVRLQQDDLFGDLWVQDPAAATGEDAALAD